MKKQALFILLLVSSLTQANTVESTFRPDSSLPLELRENILHAIKSECGNLITAYGLREITTEVRIERVDQGVLDYYYETTFSSRYYFDRMHPTHTTITVASAKYAVTNGDPFVVSRVESQHGCEQSQAQ